MRSRTWSGWFATSKPATLAWPPLGASRVHSTLVTVDLPAPLGPSRPNTSPLRNRKDTSRTTGRPLKDFFNPVTIRPIMSSTASGSSISVSDTVASDLIFPSIL